MKKLLSILMLLVAIVIGAKADDVTATWGNVSSGKMSATLAPTNAEAVASNAVLVTSPVSFSFNGTSSVSGDSNSGLGSVTATKIAIPKNTVLSADAEMVNFTLKPNDGYTFTPSSIVFYAAVNSFGNKNASDNQYISYAVYSGTTEVVAKTIPQIGRSDSGTGLTKIIINTGLGSDYDSTDGLTLKLYLNSGYSQEKGKNIVIYGVSFAGAINTASLDPSLSVAPATANPFTYVAGEGPSAVQKFTVSLANSTKAVSATLSSSNYEMSKTGESYTSEAFTDLDNGSEVYVRLKAGLAKGTGYDGTLTFANADVTDNVVVNFSGSVTSQTYAVNYDLNGGSGETPTQDPQEAGAKFNLAAAPTKDFTTFAGWLCNVDGQTYDAGAEYTMTAEATTFTAQWTGPSYSSTLDFAANSAAAPAIATFLASGNMISDVEGEWEALTAGKEGYGGFKVKKNNASLKFLAQAGTHVTITLGSINHAVTLKKNGTTAGTISGGTGYTGNTKMAIVAFDAGEEDVLVELVTSDNKTVTLIKIAIEDALASTPVNVGETGFATIGLPYATTIPEGVTAYSVSAKSETAVTLSSAIAAGTTIPANKGFIIVANKGNYTFNQFANDTWQGDVANKLEATGASAKVAAAEGEFYYFAIINADKKKVGFKKCAENASLAANKAYLPGAGLNANSLSLSFDGETAINGIAESEANAEAPVKVVKNGQLFIGNYNVAGARIK